MFLPLSFLLSQQSLLTWQLLLISYVILFLLIHRISLSLPLSRLFLSMSHHHLNMFASFSWVHSRDFLGYYWSISYSYRSDVSAHRVAGTHDDRDHKLRLSQSAIPPSSLHFRVYLFMFSGALDGCANIGTTTVTMAQMALMKEMMLQSSMLLVIVDRVPIVICDKNGELTNWDWIAWFVISLTHFLIIIIAHI